MGMAALIIAASISLLPKVRPGMDQVPGPCQHWRAPRHEKFLTAGLALCLLAATGLAHASSDPLQVRSWAAACANCHGTGPGTTRATNRWPAATRTRC